jgi:predicted transcriptional regulator
MMDRTTIMLPPELKTKAANQAKKMRISLGQYIREAVRKSLEGENKREANDDSLFLDNAVFDGIAPENLASGHDEYLYGEGR